MRASPTARSLKHWRQAGYMVERVEQRLPIPGRYITRDLFGFADLLAVNDKETVAIQVTTMSNLAAREAKARQLDSLRFWLDCPGLVGRRFVLDGWAKRGSRGKRKLWRRTERDIRREEMNDESKGHPSRH